MLNELVIFWCEWTTAINSHTHIYINTHNFPLPYSEKCQPWLFWVWFQKSVTINSAAITTISGNITVYIKKVSWCISQLPVYFWNSWWGTRGSPSRDGRFCAADHPDDLIDMSWECRRRPDTLHGVNLWTRITLLAPYFLSVAFSQPLMDHILDFVK